MRAGQFWVCVLSFMFMAVSASALELEVKMLAQDSALLVIDGKQRMLRAGKSSPEGVKLIAATGKEAVIEIDGERQTLGLSRRISTNFTKAARAEVRIASSSGGHYRTPGRVNGFPVDFMVDTGATYIAMNYHDAERLGLDYRAGKAIKVNTANGIATAYLVTLNRVAVGDIELHQIPAIVHDSDSPWMMLLGNSFLTRVDVSIDRGVLLLRAKR